jgi:hypothetical protein
MFLLRNKKRNLLIFVYFGFLVSYAYNAHHTKGCDTMAGRAAQALAAVYQQSTYAPGDGYENHAVNKQKKRNG